ncbi:hypothetical protein IOC51_06795 [Vibrio parahaemolyticus]|uniref:hypothetical protein n=1 Tax=Vibrio parahaemolyticus TaxID=670 RepID=UPI001E50A2E0|nr:hypothetical protein [Vibrio parahaemolyticus]MCD1413743.1 hypothetical protein [Vibrio parahaemolyticus]
MSIDIMLALNLEGASDEERGKFYESLEGSGWMKLPSVDTLWIMSTRKAINKIGAEMLVKSSLDKASKISNAHFSAWYMIAPGDNALRGHHNNHLLGRPPVKTVLGEP